MEPKKNEKIQMEEIRKDRSLKAYTLENEKLRLLKELKEEFQKTKTEVCIERAKLMTAYLKQQNSSDPVELQQAKAINNYLSKREALFLNDNLLAGGSTSKRLGAPVYPEFVALTIWPELDTISTRQANPQILSKEDANILNFEVFPYWLDRTVLEVTRKRTKNFQPLRLFEKLVFYINSKSSVISHTTPCYEQVLHLGLNAMIKQAKEKEAEYQKDPKKCYFYQAMQVAMEGIINYANNLAVKASECAAAETDPWRKANFQKMAEICSKVPANPAESYREAVNSLWLCHIGVLAENINMALNPGRLDQILYPFFLKDLSENKITIEEALAITGCLWFKIGDNTNLVPQSADQLFGGAGAVPAVTLGGVDANGEDAVNDLTYIMLRVTELLKLRDPNVNARYYRGVNDLAYRDRVSEVIINTRAIPAFYNDEINIATLVKQGVSLEHARDYAIVGCVEINSAGREYAATSSLFIDLNAAMDLTLNNGKRPMFTGDEQLNPDKTLDPKNFKTYDDFWAAFTKQLTWLVEQAIIVNEEMGRTHQEILPTPLLSCFMDGPMEKGEDLIFGGARYNSSGATHIAFADVCDSLNAIEFAVYQKKTYTLEEIIDAVSKNFQIKEKHGTVDDQTMLSYLRAAPKFGTDSDIAKNNSKKLAQFLYDLYQQHTNYRGGKYRSAFWTMTNHAGLGKLAGALPSGRKKGVVFSSGITPVSQCAPELLGVYNAVAELGKELIIPSGYALNIKYTPQTSPENPDYRKIFGDMIEGYFKNGGMQVQFNIQKYEDLIQAKEDLKKNPPKKHPDLIVRVSGYSAYFDDLNDAMQDELITRTQYNLISGKAEPLP